MRQLVCFFFVSKIFQFYVRDYYLYANILHRNFLHFTPPPPRRTAPNSRRLMAPTPTPTSSKWRPKSHVGGGVKHMISSQCLLCNHHSRPFEYHSYVQYNMPLFISCVQCCMSNSAAEYEPTEDEPPVVFIVNDVNPMFVNPQTSIVSVPCSCFVVFSLPMFQPLTAQAASRYFMVPVHHHEDKHGSTTVVWIFAFIFVGAAAATGVFFYKRSSTKWAYRSAPSGSHETFSSEYRLFIFCFYKFDLPALNVAAAVSWPQTPSTTPPPENLGMATTPFRLFRILESTNIWHLSFMWGWETIPI